MPQKSNHKTDRETITRFDQIINVGPATTRDLKRLGFKQPQDLIGQAPIEMYREVCRLDKTFYDPCVLDVFMATVDYMNGNPPRQWWHYTPQRKKQFSPDIEKLRNRYA